MNWLKLFHEARKDLKLRALSAAQFRVWFNLLCYASEQEVRGEIAGRPDDLLAIECADNDVALLVETVTRLETLQCVTCNIDSARCRHIVFKSWSKRQLFSFSREERGSTERVRKHRKDKDLQHKKTTRKPRPNVTACNRNEAAMKPHGNASDTDSDTELECGGSPHTPNAGGRGNPDPLFVFELPHPEEAPAEPRPRTPPPENDPAEVQRVGRFAEEALGQFGLGRMVEQDARKHKIAYIEEAILIARDARRTDWRYVRGIFERFTARGQSDSEARRESGSGAATTTGGAAPRKLSRAQEQIERARRSAAAERTATDGDG